MFKAVVQSLEKKEFEGNVYSITLPTVLGEVCLLSDHIHYFAEITQGVIKLTDEHNTIYKFHIERGYVLFKDNACKVWDLEAF